MRALLANTLQHGRFKYLYSYGDPPRQSQQQQQPDGGADALSEPQEQQPSQQQGAADVPYPADTHFVDVTQSLLAMDQQLQHSSFLFRRAPLSTTLQIKLPAQVMWDWQLADLANSTLQESQAAASGAGPQRIPRTSSQQLPVLPDE
jgi:hypothetical protein